MGRGAGIGRVLASVTGAAVVGISFAASATAGDFGAVRGYEKCESAFKSEKRGRGLVLDRTYFVKKAKGAHSFYINGQAWADGERDAVRMSCVTSHNGRRIVSTEVDRGRYVGTRTSVEVAQR